MRANSRRNHVPGRYGQRQRLAPSGVDEGLTAAEARVHRALPDASADAVGQQPPHDVVLLRREGIGRTLQHPEPKRDALGVGQSVVAELNLRAVLVERPVRLDALARGEPDLLGDSVAGPLHQLPVVGQQPLHEVVAREPDLVLAGASELRPFQNPQSSCDLFGGRFVAEHQQNGGQLFRNADLVVPPVGTPGVDPQPEPDAGMEHVAQPLAAVALRTGVRPKFGQGVEPRQVERRLPASAGAVRVVDVAPAPLLVDQAEQTPHLLRRKMYGHVELQQQHIVGAAVVRALDEAFRELPVGGVRCRRGPDERRTEGVQGPGAGMNGGTGEQSGVCQKAFHDPPVNRNGRGRCPAIRSRRRACGCGTSACRSPPSRFRPRWDSGSAGRSCGPGAGGPGCNRTPDPRRRSKTTRP